MTLSKTGTLLLVECHFYECHFDECHFDECHFDEWHFDGITYNYFIKDITYNYFSYNDTNDTTYNINRCNTTYMTLSIAIGKVTYKENQF